MPHNTVLSSGGGPKIHKGVYYFETSRQADEWAAGGAWVLGRQVKFELGYAIQAGKSGNYAGPGEFPRPWNGLEAVSHE